MWVAAGRTGRCGITSGWPTEGPRCSANCAGQTCPKPALRRTHAPRRHVCREQGSPGSNGDPAQAPMQRNVAQTWVETVAVLMASSSRIAASSLMATWKPLRALPGQPSNLAAASGAPPLCPCLDNICTSLHHARWRSGVSGTSTVRPEGHGSFCACVGTLCGAVAACRVCSRFSPDASFHPKRSEWHKLIRSLVWWVVACRPMPCTRLTQRRPRAPVAGMHDADTTADVLDFATTPAKSAARDVQRSTSVRALVYEASATPSQ